MKSRYDDDARHKEKIIIRVALVYIHTYRYIGAHVDASNLLHLTLPN
jgi:hypothetical protein